MNINESAIQQVIAHALESLEMRFKVRDKVVISVTTMNIWLTTLDEAERILGNISKITSNRINSLRYEIEGAIRKKKETEKTLEELARELEKRRPDYIDEERLLELFAKYKEQIAKLVKLAQEDNPQ